MCREMTSGNEVRAIKRSSALTLALSCDGQEGSIGRYGNAVSEEYVAGCEFGARDWA